VVLTCTIPRPWNAITHDRLSLDPRVARPGTPQRGVRRAPRWSRSRCSEVWQRREAGVQRGQAQRAGPGTEVRDYLRACNSWQSCPRLGVAQRDVRSPPPRPLVTRAASHLDTVCCSATRGQVDRRTTQAARPWPRWPSMPAPRRPSRPIPTPRTRLAPRVATRKAPRAPGTGSTTPNPSRTGRTARPAPDRLAQHSLHRFARYRKAARPCRLQVLVAQPAREVAPPRRIPTGTGAGLVVSWPRAPALRPRYARGHVRAVGPPRTADS